MRGEKQKEEKEGKKGETAAGTMRNIILRRTAKTHRSAGERDGRLGVAEGEKETWADCPVRFQVSKCPTPFPKGGVCVLPSFTRPSLSIMYIYI